VSQAFCKIKGVRILTKTCTKKPRSYEIAKQMIKFSSDISLFSLHLAKEIICPKHNSVSSRMTYH